MIKCENRYCVYYKSRKCILSKININTTGLCDECILVHLSEKELDKKRREVLKKLKF